MAGRDLARDGAPLGEALDALRRTSQLVRGEEPRFSDIQALCLGWSETTLGFVNRISCEDPLTGLASLSHLRSRLSELYRTQFRESRAVRETHALVLADAAGLLDPSVAPMTRSLLLSTMGDAARAVFSGEETVGRLGSSRVAVLARRDDKLGQRVALLRRMVAELDVVDHPPRVWIEGLPATDASCAGLLDELARG